ncbi:MAG: hypothetical protein SPI94_02575 [Candidatus Onthovivens sp.]|nr:hypothetical protein [Candidatus Onthovivens sp.]
MKKRKILMLTLPLVGVATIVGSGFSAWYFNETTVSDSATLGVAVTELHVTAGTLTIDLPVGAKVVLDQGGATKAADLKELIYVATESSGNYTKVNSFDVTFSIPTTSAAGLKDSGIKATLTLTPTVNPTLLTYIDVTTSLITLNKTFTLAADENPGDGWTRSISGDNTLYTTTVSLPASNAGTLFKYKEGKKPTTVAAYNAMTTALSSVTEAITFSGSVTFSA